MKRWLTVTLIFALMLPAGGYALAGFDPDTDYMDIMIDCAVSGDYEKGVATEVTRDEKIEVLDMDCEPIAFEDLYLLSKIIYAEAGSNWISDEWKMCVGEVVLNRVASFEFPNTIREVLEQPGQYYGKNNPYFERLVPTERCVALAQRLLEGERHMEPSVVFQANFRQGGGVYLKYSDTSLGDTYFCYSSRYELYEG